MSQGEQAKLIKIGLFTIVACGIFVVAILSVGRKTGYFSTSYNLVAEFKGVKGLDIGQPVWLSGLDVGIVERIRLSPETEGFVLVTLSIEQKYQEFIRGDSVAALSSKGLLGDKIVNISMGSPVSAVLQDGDQIRTEEPMELGDIIDEVGSMLSSVKVSLKGVEDAIGGIAAGQGTLGKLVKDDTIHNEASDLLKNINQVLKSINNAEGTLGKLVSDDALYTDLEGIIAKIDHGDGSLAQLLNSNEIHTNLAEASASIDKLFATAATGSGSVGQLMINEDFHDSLVDLLRDIKENPGRYVNVSVFGGRRNK